MWLFKMRGIGQREALESTDGAGGICTVGLETGRVWKLMVKV